MGWLLFTLIVYFVVLLGIAIRNSNRMTTMSDYVLASRSMGSFTSALSAGSSTLSAATVLAIPGIVFSDGLMWALPSLSLVLGITASWIIVAKRLRRYSLMAGDSLTIPEFLEKRFRDTTGLLRGFGSLISFFCISFYVAAGLSAGSKLLEWELGIDRVAGVFITLGAVASYTFIGGFSAVSKTDVLQALLMLSTIALPVGLIFHVGSSFYWEPGTSDLINPLTDSEGSFLGAVFLMSGVGWGLGAFGSQRLLQRFMAIKDERSIHASAYTSTAWAAAVVFICVAWGLIAQLTLVHQGLFDTVTDSENLYFLVASIVLQPPVAAIAVTGVVATIMSTADSQLLLASAIMTDDIPFLNRFTRVMSTRARMWIGRYSMLGIGVAAAMLAITNPDSVLDLVIFAWGGMGSAFGPILILALYWRRFNFYGALAGMTVGIIATSIWFFLDGGPGKVLDIAPTTPGFLLAMAAAILVTLFTPKPSPETVALFDEVIPPDSGVTAQTPAVGTV